MTFPQVGDGGDIPVASLGSFFMKWQCRVRQQSMRDNAGRPDEAIAPAVYLPDQSEPAGRFITVLNRRQRHSVIPELRHMVATTNDLSQRRDQTTEFFSARYYQHPSWFSETLTATFAPVSALAGRLCDVSEVRMVFAAFAHFFDLRCLVRAIGAGDPLRESTLAHNRLFNPLLPHDVLVIGFTPDWSRSSGRSASGVLFNGPRM